MDDVFRVGVRLVGELCDGRLIESDGFDFVLSGPKTGIGAVWHRYHGPAATPDPSISELREYRLGFADIEDGINQMLGHDETLRKPPRLAWGNLINALADRTGATVDERQLIETELIIRFDSHVVRELQSSESSNQPR